LAKYQAMTTPSYIFDNAVEPAAAQRFNSLDGLYNRRTFDFLEATGIGPGWRCLEVGGGSGAVATWMAERVGPSGYVMLTDIDPRFAEASGRCANIELRRHDIATDPLPERAFHLIHARLVLQHVPQRHDALNRLVRALERGGWLVIEEFEPRLIDRTIPTCDPAKAARYRKMVQALGRLMDDRGFEADWPRRLYQRLKTLGLRDVGMEGQFAVREGCSLGASLDSANFRQVRDEAVRKGLITESEICAVLSDLETPDFAVFSPVMLTAWGRRCDALTRGASSPCSRPRNTPTSPSAT